MGTEEEVIVVVIRHRDCRIVVDSVWRDRQKAMARLQELDLETNRAEAAAVAMPAEAVRPREIFEARQCRTCGEWEP